jgi:hypothetical protein
MAADSADELVEMRFFVTRDTFNVFDAVSKADRIPKNKLGASVFDEWAARQIHRAQMVSRLTRNGNGNDVQSGWGELSE